MEAESENPTGLAIGELSRLTGISTHALRIWERRYGSPRSERLPSGHRRYPKEEVPRLRAVSRALKAGLRAKKVVPASLDELEKLLQLAPMLSGKGQEPERAATENTEISRQMVVENWIDGVHRYCNQTLTRGFHEAWSRKGPLHFVTECAAPFVEQVGRGWEEGELSISQEHFASARLGDFLGSMWRRLSERNEGELCLLAGLPGEAHSLGLGMAAVVTAVTGRKIIYLGANTPQEEIIDSAKSCGAALVCVSVSVSYDLHRGSALLKKIRKELEPSTRVAAGGQGAPANVRGVTTFDNLLGYYEWMEKSPSR